MKVYINRKPIKGPWGGGNKFVSSLADYLNRLGHEITYILTNDIDVIFCFDPRPNNEGIWYQHFLNHKKKFGTKIIQRIGDVGTHSKPELAQLVKASSMHSDHVIFPSLWAKEKVNYTKNNFSVIQNGPLKIFYSNKKVVNKNKNRLKIVTHHWSTNEKKGYDFYEYLGSKIASGEIKNVEFTFIGRYNDKFSHEGINLVKPMTEAELSLELPNHDIYLTSSLEEAGANHVLEAMAVGLPIFYRVNGGSINEYCKDYGIEYSKKEELLQIKNKFKSFKFKKYERTIIDVVKEYEEIICKT